MHDEAGPAVTPLSLLIPHQSLIKMTLFLLQVSTYAQATVWKSKSDLKSADKGFVEQNDVIHFKHWHCLIVLPHATCPIEEYKMMIKM